MTLKENIRNTNQKGQALIIILLVMSVVLTVVLASVSRSVTEVAVTGHEEEALRAFSAAEAGVEDKLLNPVIGLGSPVYPAHPDQSVSYTVDVTQHNITHGGGGKQLAYPELLSSGESATFWLVSQDGDGQFICDATHPCWGGTFFDVCYGASDPAIEVSVYYDETGKSRGVPNNYEDVKVYRKVYDTEGRIPGADDPGNPQCNYSDGMHFEHRARLTMSDIPSAADCSRGAASAGCALFVRVRMLYGDDQPVGFWAAPGSTVISGQGILISSTGTAGESKRKVEVYQGYPEPLDLFDTAVFSLNGLTK